MSAEESCEYVLRPDDPETWGGDEGEICEVDPTVLNDNGVWTCPHDTAPGADRCPFHQPNSATDDDTVRNAFVDALREYDPDADEEDGEARGVQFLGAKFGDFDISDRPDLDPIAAPIRLSHAEISGSFDLSGRTFEKRPIFVKATFSRFADFGETTFEAGVSFEFATFRQYAFFGDTTFGAGGTTDFAEVTFEDGAEFTQATFQNFADFFEAEFKAHAQFRDAAFNSSTRFPLATFTGEAIFIQTTFGGETKFSEVTFIDAARFYAATFAVGPQFNRATFGNPTVFTGVDLTDCNFNGADLTEASLTGATLHRANLESALLSRASLVGADLRGAKLAGAVFGDVRLDSETKFLGHPDADEHARHTIAAIRAQLTCVYDPAFGGEHKAVDIEKAKSVYRALEELGSSHARSRLQARSFVRRQDLQKRGYRRDATAGDATIQQRLIAGGRWLRSKTSRAVLLYGESPWRIIAWSLGIILICAFVYPVFGWIRPVGEPPITYGPVGTNLDEFGTALYYSTLTFTALGFGDFQPVEFGRVLTTIETGLGAVLLALLVFILGRRAAR